MEEDSNIPQSFFCPLTHEVMKDPVVDHEGNSYERVAIEAWLQHNLTSPITRNHLSVDHLSPNRALRDTIETYLKEKNVNLGSPSANVQPVEVEAPVQESKVSLNVQSVALNNEVFVLASIVPPVGVSRTPSDICCVIDVSGSMNDEASVKSDTGATESHGLSLLDIVKHAVGTIIEAMLPQDRLSVISFSNAATVRVPLTQMDAAGKQRAQKELKELKAAGSTNFWDGLRTGLEHVRTNTTAGRLANLLILTDGCPTISPPRGEVAMMKKYKEEHKSDFPCAVTTFGFGYSVNSDLLKDIAVLGDGMYSFIPDSSLVGTVFVNSITNLLCSLAKNTKLILTPEGNTKIDKVYGGFPVEEVSHGSQVVDLSSLQYDQKKDILIKIANSNSIIGYFSNQTPTVTVKLQFEHWNSKTLVVDTATSSFPVPPDQVPDFEYHQNRFLLIEGLRDIILKMKSDKKAATKKLQEIISAIEKSADPNVKALLADAQGQISEAISKDEWWNRWGRHYLPSLMGAHLFQQCNNFKDPGIQSYGGPLFQKIRDEVEVIFNSLPPPEPSIKKYDAGTGSATYSAPLTNMNVYYNAYGGCFDGNCNVQMSSGQRKLVKDIQKGDKIASPDGSGSIVECVLKMNCPAGSTSLVELPGGLRITSYHPVRVDSKWTFPCDLASAQVVPCEAVYTFVLNQKSSHIMIINGVECVTLGHNLKEDVVSHEFFGTDVVVNEMKRMRGWENGFVEFSNMATCFVRDVNTNRVCGFNLGEHVMTPGM